MKTYLFDTIERYRRFSESLDVKVVICNKSWSVFNDSGEKDIYIFQEDGSLIISNNGKVTNGTWKYIPANKSVIINGNNQSYMLHPAFMDEILFALQVDGTQQCAFLIDENNKESFEPKNYSELLQYFHSKEQLEMDKKKEEKPRIENDKKLTEKIRRSDNPLDYIGKEQVVSESFKEIRVKIGDKFIDIPTGKKYLEELEEFPLIIKGLKKKHYFLLGFLQALSSLWFILALGLMAILFVAIIFDWGYKLFTDVPLIPNISPNESPILLWIIISGTVIMCLGFFMPYLSSLLKTIQEKAFWETEKELGIKIASETAYEFLNR